jgi:hypothetical protein
LLIDKISKNRKGLSVFLESNIYKPIKVIKILELYINSSYLKPTDACQTKASSKNITGIAGMMSTIGRKAA